MKEQPYIRVLIARSQRAVESGQSDDVIQCDTLKEAREKAKHSLTTEYVRLTEVSEPMNYARVMKDDEIVAEYWRKGYQEPKDEE